MRNLIGLTGPSQFTPECIAVVEEYYKSDFVMLYQNKVEVLAAWLDKCKGVIVAGGADIHPSAYNKSIYSGKNFTKFDLKRDQRELFIIDYCLKNKIPLLGICRGHQLIGVRLGFRIIPDLAGSRIVHQPQRESIQYNEDEPVHSVDPVEEHLEEWKSIFSKQKERGFINSLMGYETDSIYVNSFHHQGVGQTKDIQGVTVLGVADTGMENAKKIIEVMKGDNWISCQWHPEYDYNKNTSSSDILRYFGRMMG